MAAAVPTAARPQRSDTGGERWRALVLCTPKELLAAQRLYEQMGFVRTPGRDWSPRPSVDLVAYALPLRCG